MKKIINILIIVLGAITGAVIICTLLTSYQFLYLGIWFNSYLPIQIGLSVTMGLLSIRFLFLERGRERYIYFLISLLFCIGIAYSITIVK